MKDQTSETGGDIAAALEAGRELGGILESDSHGFWVRLRSRDGGERIERVEVDQPRPQRKRGTVELLDAKSLIAYADRHRSPDTVVYADSSEGHEQITAVLDDHGEEPGHGHHRAFYACPRSVEWTSWKRLLDKRVSQEGMVDFLEERALDVVEPVAAELQEMLRELSIRKDVSWKKAFDERSGTVRLEYREDVTETADRAGQVALPNHFTIGVPIFVGGESYKCEVRLRYRLADAKLSFVVSIDNVQRIEEVAFAETVKEIEAGLGGTLVLLGRAPG